MQDYLGLLWLRSEITGMGKIRFEFVRLAGTIVDKARQNRDRDGKDQVR